MVNDDLHLDPRAEPANDYEVQNGEDGQGGS